MTNTPDPLMRVGIDGTCTPVGNAYEHIKAALDGATLDFTQVSTSAGFYVDDDGINNRLALNVTASMYAVRPLYGPVVLCAALPDGEGNTLPPTREDVAWFLTVGDRWNRVVTGIMVQCSGDPHTYGDPDNLAGPIILTDEDFDAFFRTEGEA